MYPRIQFLLAEYIRIWCKLGGFSFVCSKFVKMIFKLSYVFNIYFAFAMPTEMATETATARTFAKFWNFSLVFPDASVTNVSSVTWVLPTRPECVSLCGMNAGCCCTQWVPSNNTCTILMADRAGLSPNPLAVSSIDSTLT